MGGTGAAVGAVGGAVLRVLGGVSSGIELRISTSIWFRGVFVSVGGRCGKDANIEGEPNSSTCRRVISILSRPIQKRVHTSNVPPSKLHSTKCPY